MITLSAEVDLDFHDGTYRFVRRAGNNVQLQNLATGEHSTVFITDIAARMKVIPAPTTTPPQALSHLTKKELAEVERLAAHLEEMISGYREGYDAPRADYDPELTTLNVRMQAKGIEMLAAGLPSSRAQLYKLKGRYEQGGPAALIDRRTVQHHGPLDRADPRILEAIAVVISQRKDMTTVTQKMLHSLVRQELTNTYKENAPEFVPEQTLYRYFKLLGKGKWVTGKATRRRSAGNTPDRTYGGTRRLLPGEEVQVDSTPMDVMVMTSEGPQRPILTIMIDIATRAIISITIRLIAAKGYDHALLLARALTPIGSRPDNTVHRALISARYPEVKLLSAEERDHLKMTTPFIFPRRIMMDNGMDFISNTFKSACHVHQVDITQAAIRTPTDKAVVERAFRTINDLFTQYLPGYVGDSPVNRGLDVEKEKLLDVSTVNEMLDDWVIGTYNHRPHGGLIDPFDPTITYSPVEWFNASVDFVGGATLPLTQDQFIELLPSTPRKITKKGIHVFNRDYDSIDLHPYRDRKSKNPRLNGGWEVKYNPYDLSSVWVLSPEKNWIECRWRHSAMIAQPHFADIQRNLQKNRADRADVAFENAAGYGTPMPRGTTDLLDPTFAESEFDWSADDLALVFDNYDPDKE